MILDAIVGLLVIVVCIGFVAITLGDIALHRLWNRIWKRPDPKKPRDPWTDRTGI